MLKEPLLKATVGDQLKTVVFDSKTWKFHSFVQPLDFSHQIISKTVRPKARTDNQIVGKITEALMSLFCRKTSSAFHQFL